MTTTTASYQCAKGHQTTIEVNNAKINVTVRCSHKGCPETAYYQPPVKWETGATNHAVNELILFTDNTRELAELRDEIYLQRAQDRSNDFAMVRRLRYELLEAAKKQYKQELPTNHTHVTLMTIDESWEYVQLYNNEFLDTWKKEHGY